MGGPAAVVYLRHELSQREVDSVEELFNDRSWRVCEPNANVMTVHIEDINYLNSEADIDALEATLGWRPQQQIEVVAHAKSAIEYHIDLALGAARLARMFAGRVEVFADQSDYDRMKSPSQEIDHPEFGVRPERIVRPEWLDEFITLDEPRFRK